MLAYVFQAEFVCQDCAIPIIESLGESFEPSEFHDSNDVPQGPYDMQFQESDSPDHCGKCGLFLENPLTTDGYNYIQDMESIPDEWATFYNVSNHRPDIADQIAEDYRIITGGN